MVDLGTQLREYLDATAPAVELEDIVLAPAGDDPVRPFRPRRPARPIQGWVSAAAAAIVTLLLVGGVAWLSRSDPVPPASEPTVTVPLETTIPSTTTMPTDTSIPTSTSVTTTTTEASAALSLAGDGPQLEFVQVENPSAIRWGGHGHSVWFGAALYVIADGELVRSSDGFTWEPAPGPENLDQIAGGGSLISDGEQLVNFGFDGESCRQDAILVNRSTNGSSWVTSRIDLPILDSGRCSWSFGFGPVPAAVGPKGILISAEGTRPDGPDAGLGFAWFSEDGTDWQQLDTSDIFGPGSEIGAVAATPDGFLASTDPPGEWLWESGDGITWTRTAHLSQQIGDGPPRQYSTLTMWNDTLVAATTEGVWTIEDEPRELIPADSTSDLSEMHFGGLGLVALAAEWDGGGTEVLFSADGTTWNRWSPQELGDGFATLYMVGVGDDFVALWRLSSQGETSLWVASLR